MLVHAWSHCSLEGEQEDSPQVLCQADDIGSDSLMLTHYPVLFPFFLYQSCSLMAKTQWLMASLHEIEVSKLLNGGFGYQCGWWGPHLFLLLKFHSRAQWIWAG